MNTKLPLKIFIGSILMSLIYLPKTYAQNLLDMSGWTVGAGSSGGFSVNGLATESTREWGEGPQGGHAILWKAKPSGDQQGDGGFNAQAVPIVHTNMYRFTIWLKKTNSTDGGSFFGCTHVANLNGVANVNAYFWSGDLPQLNKWYLLVGYIHGSGDVSTVSYGGIYDGITGAKVVNTTDFKFAAGTVNTYLRSYLYYDPNVSDLQYFYSPRIDLVNGNEPTIAALLGLSSISSSSDQAYFSGKVGIKTTTPGDYDLAVNGKIRSKEVKVDAANWPDYVFNDDYKMMSLPDLKRYIEENKHLPGVPAAAKIEAEGVYLGEINKTLLQKLEEVTLHIIELDKKIEILGKENERLKDSLKLIN